MAWSSRRNVFNIYQQNFAPQQINLTWRSQSKYDSDSLTLGLDGVFYGSANINQKSVSINVENLSYTSKNSMYGDSEELYLTSGQKNAIRDLIDRCRRTNINIAASGSDDLARFANSYINNR